MAEEQLIPQSNVEQLEAERINKSVDVVTKVATATAMSVTTSYCIERKFLQDVACKNEHFYIYKHTKGELDLENVQWIQVQQIGRPAEQDFAACFSALQNILRSCSLPDTQLLFLVVGENRRFKMYIGIHHFSNVGIDNIERGTNEISSFCNVSWPGMKTRAVGCTNDIDYFHHKYAHAYAFTGIPSQDLKETNYPSTLEYLLGGQQSAGSIAYLVVAENISENDLSTITYQLDEIRGQVESFKTFNYSETVQKGTSSSFSKTVTETIGKSESKGDSRKDFEPLRNLFAKKGFETADKLNFSPVKGLMALGGTAVAVATLGSGALIGVGLLAGLLPQKSENISENEQHSTAEGTTNTTSENYTQTLGQNFVNGHLESLAEDLKLQSERYRTGRAQGMWRVGCYLFTDDDNSSSQIQLKSLLSGKSSKLEPIRIHEISRLLWKDHSQEVLPFITPPDLYVAPKNSKDAFQHPCGNSFARLTTYLTTEELTSLVNFPLHSVPGLSVIECPPQFRLDTSNVNESEGGKELGKLVNRGEETTIACSFDVNNLTRHCLVCGSNGSGKTNTVLGILNEVQRHGKNFMVIEPAKTEYVDWAIKFNEQLEQDQKEGNRQKEEPITIYMPGRKHYWHTNKNGENEKYILKDILKINPFEPVVLDDEEPNVQSHLDRIKSIFSLAFPMEDILPTVMETLLTDVYTYGEPWLNRKDDEPIPNLFPTLSLLRCRSTNVIKGLGYEQRVTANISAAINLRLSNLLSGWKRELFNNEVLGGYKKLSKAEKEQGIKRPTWDEFFNRRVVINLSGIADDNDRVFVMGLLLLYLYEYRVATSERPGFSFNDETLKHLMVIEEAHRVMTKNSDPNSPQYKCGALFSQILSEIRAYGQGMMVVDQIPSRLIEDATKNTNLKIVHRLIAADDIDSVSSSMGVNDEQKRIFPKLTVGQAVIAGLNASMSESVGGEDIYWVKIKNNK